MLIAAAGLTAGIDALPIHLGLLAPLPSLLPIDPDISGPLVAVAVAAGLIGLSVGLARRKRLAWWLAVAALAAALAEQIQLLQDVVPALLAAVCLGLLLATRGRYRVETSRHARRLALLLWGGGALLAVGGLGLAVGTRFGLVSPAVNAGDMTTALLEWLAFGNPDLFVQPVVPGSLLVAIAVVARLAIAAGVILALAPDVATPNGDAAKRHAASVADRYGQGALLPFQLGEDTERFVLPDRDAIVAYGIDGRVAIILGDPIGPPEQAHRILGDFLAACSERDWVPAVYQASASALPPLRRRGYVAYPIGREAILELESFGLCGPRRANLRHTVTRARSAGLSVEWQPDGLGTAQGNVLQELMAVDRAWLAGARAPLRFTVSSFQAADLIANPIAIGREADGRVVAFTTFRATGRDNGWVLDLMRRVPGSVPGGVESCLVEAALELRLRGASTLSLGLVPLAGLDPWHGSPVERTLGIGVQMLRRFYDVAGLAFFKAKFDPRWEPRYLVAARRAHLPRVILALVRLHLGGSRGLLRAGRRPRMAA